MVRVMIVPFVLCLVSVGLAGLSWHLYGPVLSDLALLAALWAVASLILLALAARKPASAPRVKPRRAPRAKPKPRDNWVVVDGSNVIHWQDQTPQLEPVRQVLAALVGRGFTPGIVFDANAGYKLEDRFLDDRAFARLLNLPRDRVFVVPRGTPADHYILLAARDHGARVVTNDRYRDWAERFPEVTDPGFLIRGGSRDGAAWLEPATPAPVRAAVPA